MAYFIWMKVQHMEYFLKHDHYKHMFINVNTYR